MEKWKELFDYDPSSPSGLRWKVKRTTGKDGRVILAEAGDVAGHRCKTRNRYLVTSDRRTHLAHKIVWYLHFGSVTKGFVLDHVDGDGCNNRVDNLRAVTPVINNRNRKKHKRNNTGKNGVILSTTKIGGKEYLYYVAHWSDGSGKLGKKGFSVLKFGQEVALKLACDFRDKMIESLNQAGAGYTDRHGI